MSATAAGAIGVGRVVGAALIGGRSSPTPDHPRTRRWSGSLEKPGFTPPPPGRTRAPTLWSVNQASIAAWSALFFGQRAPGLGTISAGAMVGTSAA